MKRSAEERARGRGGTGGVALNPPRAHAGPASHKIWNGMSLADRLCGPRGGQLVGDAHLGGLLRLISRNARGTVDGRRARTTLALLPGARGPCREIMVSDAAIGIRRAYQTLFASLCTEKPLLSDAHAPWRVGAAYGRHGWEKGPDAGVRLQRRGLAALGSSMSVKVPGDFGQASGKSDISVLASFTRSTKRPGTEAYTSSTTPRPQASRSSVG